MLLFNSTLGLKRMYKFWYTDNFLFLREEYGPKLVHIIHSTVHTHVGRSILKCHLYAGKDFLSKC